MDMLPKKRKVLCVEEKVSLIKAIEKGEKQTDIARRTGLSQSTVATIWKDRKKLLNADIQEGSKKKMRKPQYEHLDLAILQWFQQQRVNHIPLSGPLIKTKAVSYAVELGIVDFKASEGWLTKWKQRHNINYMQINGEADDVDRNITDGWLDKIQPSLKSQYSAEYIFNADKTGLFCKMTPNKSLKLNFINENKISEQQELDQEPESIPTPQQALEAAKVLHKFFIHYESDSVAIKDALSLKDKARALLIRLFH